MGLIPPDVKLVPQPTEIDRIFFVSIRELMQTRPSPYEVRLAKQSIYFPSLRVQNEVIWGLTARILMSLFEYGFKYKKKWPFLMNSPNFKTPKFK